MTTPPLPDRAHHGDKETLPIDSKIDHDSSIRYWNSTPATVGAMLGNLGCYPWYSRIDLQGSANFLAKVRRLAGSHVTEKKLKMGVDCGAGVGRVTKGFLLNVCDVVDVVEPIENFVSVLRQELGSKEKEEGKEDSLVGDIYVTGLEN